ncbi:MAG TPA: transglycosylase family protein [Solirubrobacteraceae bacterium]|nr:transglycosylase family protein [Solirubrobacteraceae bacterium]
MRAAIALAVLLACASLPTAAAAQGESALRDRIERGRERERSLSGAVARLGSMVDRAGREVTIVQGRLVAVEADLAAAEAVLASTRDRLRTGRRRLVRLQRRHAEGRDLLAEQLVADYKADPPDIVSIVVGATSFSDLLERIAFARRVRERNSEIVARVRDARVRTRGLASRLGRLAAQRREAAQAIDARRAALASMRDGLAARQATLVRARTARAEALAGTRSGRASAQHALDRLIAARERAAAAAERGPGGPWAIPWPIVQCESGGQNLPPNGAGASGYYQMLPSTWEGLGGSTRHAYQAPKAEQDRLAANLWAGGAGARNWVCAGLV